MVVAINKFDCGNYTYTNLRNAPEKRFEELKAEISRYTKTVGFKPENVTFVPISALTGNISSAKKNINSINNLNP